MNLDKSNSPEKWVTMNVVNRYGPDDLSLWTVDFTDNVLERFSKEVSRLTGDPKQVMKALPTIDHQAATSLYLLFPGERMEDVMLCLCEVDENFLKDFSHCGCSIRGTDQLVLEEYGRIWNADPLTTFLSKNAYEEVICERGNEMTALELEKITRTAARYKEMYPPGTRVKVNHMEDTFAPVPAGTRGTVTVVDAIGQIHMKWDNGQSLALIPGVDSFRKLTAEEIAKEEKQQATDLITAEDLAEQAVYTVNAPACCSEGEKAEKMLGMLGANIQDDSIYQEEDQHQMPAMSM